MISMDEYLAQDATGLAELVARGDVTPSELLDAALRRMAEVNPAINAVVVKHEDYARRQIEQGLPDGPFRGVPFLLKDLGAALEGTRLTNGSRLFVDATASFTSTLVGRFLASGLAIFGKTNAPEFGINVSTEPVLHGPTRNPWDLGRIAGGSSGGAAAAVAAGIVPMAHASDGGGSIRIPASCCGLVGLKPSRARMPVGPVAGEGWNGLSTSHVVTRSVRDCALMLDAASGPEPGDPYAAPPPEAPFVEACRADPDPLTIAIMPHSPIGEGVAPECVDAVAEMASLLSGLGHRISEERPALDGEAIADAIVTIVAVNLATELDLFGAVRGQAVRQEEVETATWALAERGRAIPAPTYARAIRALHACGRELGRFFARHDVLLTPTLASPPPLLGEIDQNGADTEALIARIRAFNPYAPIYNASGCPAVTLPLASTGSGLPVGVMFGAPLGMEARLLTLAAQLEAARPWADCRPAPASARS